MGNTKSPWEILRFQLESWLKRATSIGEKRLFHQSKIMSLFITFEGVDGVGKSEQAMRLHNRLRKMGKEVVIVREPGGTPLGERCREILKDRNNGAHPIAELLLMNASRAQLVNDIILPSLMNGITVIADRFADSTIAYQGWGRELGRTASEVVNVAIGDVRPDITFLLQATADTRMSRTVGRESHKDKFESEAVAFYERVSEGYEHLLTTSSRFIAVDANGTMEEVQDYIWKRLETWPTSLGGQSGPDKRWKVGL